MSTQEPEQAPDENDCEVEVPDDASSVPTTVPNYIDQAEADRMNGDRRG